MSSVGLGGVSAFRSVAAAAAFNKSAKTDANPFGSGHGGALARAVQSRPNGSAGVTIPSGLTTFSVYTGSTAFRMPVAATPVDARAAASFAPVPYDAGVVQSRPGVLSVVADWATDCLRSLSGDAHGSASGEQGDDTGSADGRGAQDGNAEAA